MTRGLVIGIPAVDLDRVTGGHELPVRFPPGLLPAMRQLENGRISRRFQTRYVGKRALLAIPLGIAAAVGWRMVTD